ncbi:Ubiquinol-cytochrome c reductase complex 6.7 kDa [Gossypium arboreum]|uniref:Ubiquinol-cytochrome c reductase complex 6.7 kDa n=1 Tax=Gossypium arboreum TaxID=29729 RepID=A0A0B0P424_GOSAR|nr:Ubiquinol-cytochrome c reductase complex 6.7 kDa [Gossypium arboreum]
MAGERALFKFLKPGQRLQPADVQAAAMWGVAATTGALWLIQGENLVCRVVPVIEAPFDWLKKTFLEKPESE